MDYKLSIKNSEERDFILQYGNYQKNQGLYIGFLLGLFTVSAVYTTIAIKYGFGEGNCKV